jgi:iron complex outermembrane receptor protein
MNRHTPLFLACALVTSSYTTYAHDHSSHSPREHARIQHRVETIVVTGHNETNPTELTTALKVPRQPLPAHDGADYLKTIPGFSVTRKGGADGDVSFRGMAGSRLGLVVDGEVLLGGCNSRMDSPTAYIYPETLDQLTLIRGPQSVQYGAGYSSGVIRFDSEAPDFSAKPVSGYASATLASFGRMDGVAQLQAGSSEGFIKLTGSYSASDDYKDGDKRKLHSEYERYNGNIRVGLTPSDNTLIEVAHSYSDGEAAYADRGMDGTQFLREGTRVRWVQEQVSDAIKKVDVSYFDNSIDHVMDDQQLRTPGTMGYSNVSRDTQGGRLAVDLGWNKHAVTLGGDVQQNEHGSRSAMPHHAYSPWMTDAEITQRGLFAEWSYQYSSPLKTVMGLRYDRWQATDQRSVITSMMHSMPNPTAQQTRRDGLTSGFARVEYQHAHSLYFMGVGIAERFPDYWEIFAKESADSKSAFHVLPETNTQWDAGWLYRNNPWQVSASVFVSDVDDFIVIDYQRPMKTSGVAFNTDARTYGGEISASYKWQSGWQLEGSVAHTQGEDKATGKPLPQISPTEGRLALNYVANDWHYGLLWRLVDSQHRYQTGFGNIVGKDIGPSAGFGTLSANVGWRPQQALLVTAGVDNLFNKTYAEFISRAGNNGMGGAIGGYEQTVRVNEPGRTLWVKAQYDF